MDIACATLYWIVLVFQILTKVENRTSPKVTFIVSKVFHTHTYIIQDPEEHTYIQDPEEMLHQDLKLFSNGL